MKPSEVPEVGNECRDLMGDRVRVLERGIPRAGRTSLHGGGTPKNDGVRLEWLEGRMKGRSLVVTAGGLRDL